MRFNVNRYKIKNKLGFETSSICRRATRGEPFLFSLSKSFGSSDFLQSIFYKREKSRISLYFNKIITSFKENIILNKYFSSIKREKLERLGFLSILIK